MTKYRAPAQALGRRLLCMLPPLRSWFEDLDQLATEARLWREAQSRNILGTDPEQAAILDFLSYLTPRRAVRFEKIRLGRDGDGGYVMLDDFSGVSSALSFGIETDCSWDTAIAERGIEVHQYDHTVDGPPTDHPQFRILQEENYHVTFR